MCVYIRFPVEYKVSIDGYLSFRSIWIAQAGNGNRTFPAYTKGLALNLKVDIENQRFLEFF
jgi:hypothetical protein